MQTLSIGVREAKVQLSKLLKMVQKGGEIILTDRGRPVGKIVPIPKEDLPLKERIQSLEERGVIEPFHPKGPKRISGPLAIPNGLAQRFLREDREGA